MNLKLLAEPFKEEEIEWRLSQCGKKNNGQIWAQCLAYVQARAIMDRLDEVCGPENWRASYRHENGGVMCMLSIKCGGEWITKEDGSDATDIEAFKGGISGALKRAAVLWGVGRYLYGLETGFATIVDQAHKDKKYGKTKEGDTFYWVPPKLPEWAMPKGTVKDAVTEGRINVAPQQPKSQDGVQHNEPTLKVGKTLKGKNFAGSRPTKMESSDMEDCLMWIDETYTFLSKVIPPNVMYDKKLIEAELLRREDAFEKTSNGLAPMDFNDSP